VVLATFREAHISEMFLQMATPNFFVTIHCGRPFLLAQPREIFFLHETDN